MTLHSRHFRPKTVKTKDDVGFVNLVTDGYPPREITYLFTYVLRGETRITLVSEPRCGSSGKYGQTHQSTFGLSLHLLHLRLSYPDTDTENSRNGKTHGFRRLTHLESQCLSPF